MLFVCVPKLFFRKIVSLVLLKDPLGFLFEVF